jgi:hypothetical protein
MSRLASPTRFRNAATGDTDIFYGPRMLRLWAITGGSWGDRGSARDALALPTRCQNWAISRSTTAYTRRRGAHHVEHFIYIGAGPGGLTAAFGGTYEIPQLALYNARVGGGGPKACCCKL